MPPLYGVGEMRRFEAYSTISCEKVKRGKHNILWCLVTSDPNIFHKGGCPPGKDTNLLLGESVETIGDQVAGIFEIL